MCVDIGVGHGVDLDHDVCVDIGVGHGVDLDRERLCSLSESAGATVSVAPQIERIVDSTVGG